MAEATLVKKCRACGNASLIPCVSIGSQYLSSVFPESLDYRATLSPIPMDLVLCEKKSDATCGLVQLAHEIDLSGMYAAYPYTSATNSSMLGILQNVRRELKMPCDLAGRCRLTQQCPRFLEVKQVCVGPGGQGSVHRR